VIRDVATTGNSGSGVFDAGQKCLLGIISLKIYQTPSNEAPESEHKDIAKYFVPASIIQAFIPPEYRFYGDCHALENCYAFRGIGPTLGGEQKRCRKQNQASNDNSWPKRLPR
jgi:hypothetical protein